MIKFTQKHDVKHIKTCNHIAYILTDMRYCFVHLLIKLITYHGYV